MTPVALLHGFLGQPEAWDDVTAALRERAPRVPVEALPLPGHGRDAPVPPIAWDAAVDALAEREGLGALVAAHRARPVLAGQTWLPAAR